MPDTVTLPISPQLFWGFLGLGGGALAILLVFGVLALMGRESPTAIARQQQNYGLGGMNPGVFLLLALLWFGLFLLLVSGLYGLIWDVLWHALPDRSESTAVWDSRFRLVQLTALTTVLGGVIALPITLNKVRLSMEQTATAKAALFNTKITEAAADLHATRQVSKQVDGQWETVWEDDVVRRNAAIDRLEGLVREQPEEAGRVSRLLSVYVRELSKDFPAQKPPVTEDLAKLRNWTQSLTIARSDMEKAVQALGEFAKNDSTNLDTLEIDLSNANLQKMALRGLKFDKANFIGSHLQGANLQKGQFNGTNFSSSHLQFANLRDAKLSGTILSLAQLQGAIFSRAQITGADFRFSKMQNAWLEAAELQATDFTAAFLQRANFRHTILQKVDLSGALLSGANFYAAQIEGADLFRAQLHGTNLNFAKIDSSVSLKGTSSLCVAVQGVDLIKIVNIHRHIGELFGDGSTTLPAGTEWPDHWPRENLEWRDFETQWRAWAKTKGIDIP